MLLALIKMFIEQGNTMNLKMVWCVVLIDLVCM